MNIFEYFKKKGIDTVDASFYRRIAEWDSWYRDILILQNDRQNGSRR